MDLKFMKTVWWVFAQLYQKGLVYKGLKVMPYSTGCKTPLSSFEAGENYKVRSKYSGKTYVVAESRLSDLPNEKPKRNAANGPSGDSKKSKTKGSSGEKTKDSAADSYGVLEKFSGASLVGTKYKPLFNYFLEFSDAAFRVIADN
ncbi:hypothetical protein CRYUN_Cryun05aG0279200 [Craigia yunnanensis]